ncbi:MAG: hypothetical protein J5940_06880, partial [Clostridia bacterium]|nr:hypothetical protein [Clostridia bacterium]
MFDVEYEALDMSKSLKSGRNSLTVLFGDTGEKDRCGVVFELITEKKRLPSGCRELQLTVRRFERLSPGLRYMIGGGSGVETYDARAPKNGKKYKLRIVGNLLHNPVENMHRSRLLPQTETTVFPKGLVLRERWAEQKGFAAVLSSGEYIDTVHFATVTAERDTHITFTSFNGAEAFLDGRRLSYGTEEKVKKGQSILAIAGRSPSVFVKTDAVISDWSYARFSDKKAVKRHYPWNDPLVPYEMSDSAKCALELDNLNNIQLYKSGVAPLPSEYPAHTKLMLSAKDGLTPAAFSEAPRGRVREVGITGRDGAAVVSPSEYGAAFTFDFGSEQVGYFAFDTDAPEGTAFTIYLYELSDGKGERFVGDKNCIKYVCGGGKQEYVSHCRRGFRYAKIFSSQTDTAFSFSARLKSARYPESDGAHFVCSDAVLNKVYTMSTDTARVCMLDRYVDCPGYEQNVWTGDARITALINLINYGQYEFNSEYLELIGQSISDGLTKYYRTGNKRYSDGLALPCAAFPTYPDGNIPIWSFQWILSVCDHYLYTGDEEELRRCIGAVEETFERAEKQFSPRGLFAPEGTWNLIEWANNDLSEYGEVTANNMMLSACYTSVSHLEKALGRRKKANDYAEKGERLKQLINRFCYDEKAKKYVDTVRDEEAYGYYLAYCERTRALPDELKREPLDYKTFASLSRFSVQTATFAVLYGIAEGERLELAKKILTDCVSSGIYVPGTPAKRTAGAPSETEAPGGIVRIGSPFFMFFALDALYKTGEYGLAETAMRRDWGGIADMGVNNCPETFPSKDKFDVRSSAHGWSASPAYFMPREILGVKPLSPGFAKFSIDPHTASVGGASGTVATPHGSIFVKWKATENGYFVEYEAPDGTEYVI